VIEWSSAYPSSRPPRGRRDRLFRAKFYLSGTSGFHHMRFVAGAESGLWAASRRANERFERGQPRNWELNAP
jgi:hypothetical protein